MRRTTIRSVSSFRARSFARRSNCTGGHPPLFEQEPRVFRNTELIYSNDLAHFVSHMGYDGVLAEGADRILARAAPTLPLPPPHASKIKLLLKNYRLSDDIAFRFSSKTWEQYPLTADKFAQWVNQINGNGVCLQFVHGLRNLRRAPVGRHGHL
jgi:alpha-amylase/alpha-mannosidase (GH57 family)